MEYPQSRQVLDPRPPSNIAVAIGLVFLTCFALFWCGLTGFIDYLVGSKLLHQIVSQEFASVTGQVTHSEVTRRHGSKGSVSYGVDIRYQYEINGQPFGGHRFRYNEDGSSDSSWAIQAVAQNPVGARVPVFYNPHDPYDALLSPGVNGSDLMPVLFLTPFTLLGLGFIVAIVGKVRSQFVRPIAGGVAIATDGLRVRARLPRWPPLAWGLVTLGGMAFLETFIIGFSAGFHPSLVYISAALFLAYGVALGVYIWQRLRLLSGDEDLVIDRGAQTVQLPRTFQRKERKILPLSEIVSVVVEREESTDSKGRVHYSYAPSLRLRGEDAREEKLADWSDVTAADSFADWLRQQLGLALPRE